MVQTDRIFLYYLSSRNNNCSYDICPDSRAAETGKDYPCKTHQRGINVKIFCNAAADSAGKKTDYNYRLSCGAGTLSLEDEEFAGLGRSKIVDNDGAARKMQLECGMGTLEVSFTE